MEPSSLFEITRRDPSLNASGKLSALVAGTELKRGVALGAHGQNEDEFDLAQHDNFIGHLTRDAKETPLALADRVFGVTSTSPVGLEAPFKIGEEVSVEKAHELECEGADYIWTSGSGAISSATAVPSKLSFLEGRLRVTQSNEIVNYILTANNLTPNTAGNLRIRAEKV